MRDAGSVRPPPQRSAHCEAKWGTVVTVKSIAEEFNRTGLEATYARRGWDMLTRSGAALAMPPEDVATTPRPTT